jgi:hypothetical protein
VPGVEGDPARGSVEDDPPPDHAPVSLEVRDRPLPDVAREACHRTSAGTATLTSGGECGPVSTTSMTRSGRSSAVAQLEHVPDPDRLRDVADAEVVAPRVITVYAPPAPTSDDA